MQSLKKRVSPAGDHDLAGWYLGLYRLQHRKGHGARYRAWRRKDTGCGGISKTQALIKAKYSAE